MNGGPIGSELQDAKQGRDSSSREHFRHEAYRDFAAPDPHTSLDPYDRNPDSKEEVGRMLASGYGESVNRNYEGGSTRDEEDSSSKK